MFEPACLVKVDENGFFLYWKSEGRVSTKNAFSYLVKGIFRNDKLLFTFFVIFMI